jgi:hypothetical protein
MSRKRIYNTNRFDGGMTDSPRDTSNLTKLAYISHLDIYRDPNRMVVMPGFESFNGYDGDANGIKAFSPQDIAPVAQSIHFLLAKKSDGTGSKLFQFDVGETQWKVPTFYAGATEGSDNLVTRPFLAIVNSLAYYPVNIASLLRIARVDNSGYSSTWTSDPTISTSDNKFIYVTDSPVGNVYFIQNAFNNVHRLQNANVTWNFKTTAQGMRDIAVSDYTLGLATASFNRARNLIWDDASLLADQRNNLGLGIPRAVGAPSQIYSFVLDEFLTGSQNTIDMNGSSAMAVKALQGESINTLYRVKGFRDNANEIYPVKAGYKDTMTWYTYYAKNSGATEYENGVWAFGKGDIESQMGVSKLLDTTSLGYVKQSRWIGDNCWFINHSGDGSISRLHNFETGIYDVPATIETLIYGADSPYLKELNGVSIVTENLPSGGSVVVSYRKDEDDAWTTMGTSDTTGKQKHNFTKANGVPIGRFQEIQFRIVITGKTAVKNIMVAVTETEDLSF